jgi:hypothetical protein
MNGVVLASYQSGYFVRDYCVEIFDNTQLDDLSILMIFASHHNDYIADAR